MWVIILYLILKNIDYNCGCQCNNLKKFHDMRTERLTALAFVIFVSMVTYGQLFTSVNSDSLYIYSYSYPSENPYGQKGQIEKVYLSSVPDELLFKKKSDISQNKIESTILSKIPTAQISWIQDDVCYVIANDLDIRQVGIYELLSDNNIISLRPAYIRKVYKDIMALYPVDQYATYGFDDQIHVIINKDYETEATELIASLGLNAETPNQDTPLDRFIYVAKESDIISIANRLYESGYFEVSRPSGYMIVRETDEIPFDKSGIDFYYDSKGGKVYLYKSPGRFMIKKGDDTNQSEIEAILAKYLVAPSYVWKTNNLCKVDVDEALVDQAINDIRTEESVISVSRSYLIEPEYERELIGGTDYPTDNNFDNMVSFKLKDGVPESVKDSLKNALNLDKIEEQSGGILYTWDSNKAADVLNICQKLYESGVVDWAEPNWVSGFKIIFWSDSSNPGTTTVKIINTVSETNVKYFDLLGHRIEKPQGLTIVVTEYSDGSIKVKKVLF